jgi:hypothetical protein
MTNRIHSGLLTKNNLKEIPQEDRSKQKDYLEAIKAFTRLTYESMYIIDYENMSFEYVSENPLFLCGYTPAEVLELGYEFYFKNVPEKDLEMLSQINDAGFDFFKKLPGDEKKEYSISYDFHLVNKDGKHILVNHKLTALLLTSDKKLWKAICIVSISHQKNAGHICIYKQGSDEIWKLDLKTKVWRKSEKPKLTKREIEILQLYAQLTKLPKKYWLPPIQLSTTEGEFLIV